MYIVKLGENDLKVIAAALNEFPYRVAAPVMDSLKAQVAAIQKRHALDAALADASGPQAGQEPPVEHDDDPDND